MCRMKQCWYLQSIVNNKLWQPAQLNQTIMITVMLKLCKSMVRLGICKYNLGASLLIAILDQHKLENVQCCATKPVPSLQDTLILLALNLPSLLYGGNLTFLFKLIKGHFQLDYSSFYNILT